ncbi:hypothetical protein [Nocardia terpenica]|uniref:Uncharacterized protein n=1 Tax=Nocardia terpenica TaxID=455432 RepID=A0A6G9Z6Q5_9NOCA|nr:hypothetical protein [Nocardia terpenica]QIS21279.1 hypothetical protein F6W96_26080 [Nocardia terpenica]
MTAQLTDIAAGAEEYAEAAPNALAELAAIAGVDAPTIRKFKPLNPCRDCYRPMVSRARWRAGERDTRAHAGRGLCQSCYDKRRRRGLALPPKVVAIYRQCVQCGMPLHSSAGRKTTGTRRHAARGLCTVCHTSDSGRPAIERKHESMARAEARLNACSACGRAYGTATVSACGRAGFVRIGNIGLNLCRRCDGRRITREKKRGDTQAC